MVMHTVLPVRPPAAAPPEKECIFPRRVQWLIPMKSSNEKDTCGATASCTFSDTCVSSSYSNDSSDLLDLREGQDFLERRSSSQRRDEAGRKTQGVEHSLLLNSRTDPAFLPYHIYQQENRKVNKTKGQECQSTGSHRSTSRRIEEQTSTSADCRVSKLMFLFSSQKDTCPDRLKELHNLGKQTLLLKRTQDYIKVLNESRRLIRFEMALQKRRENLKLECAQRKRTQSFAKPLEGKHHHKRNVLHQHHNGAKNAAALKKENDCANKPPFNTYVAFNSEVI
jgi:hypothetical protein